ncbi:MAG: methionine aminotransferase [Myxococcota bacterium]
MRNVMAHRIHDVGTSIFSEMSALATRHGAVNLGQGFPDFAGPAFLKEAARAAISADLNQYAPSHGLPVLRSALARTYGPLYGRELDVDREITVTSGGTEAIMVSVLALVNPGDEVILLEPYYDSYPANVLAAGGVPRHVRLREPDWTLNPDELRAAITPRTRVIMLNTPHNPTGKVFSRAELELVAQLAREHDLVVISDEVYERLVFPPAEHVPLCTLPGMWERTVTILSAGKTFSVTGWKVGYAVASAALTEALRRVHQFCTFATATPLQAAVAAGLEAGEGYLAEFRAFYTARRDELVTALSDVGFRVRPPQGTYFVMADYRGLGGEGDLEFCRRLIREVGVAAIPPSAFFHDGHQTGHVRFCFAKQPQTLAAAAERLRKLTRA